MGPCTLLRLLGIDLSPSVAWQYYRIKQSLISLFTHFFRILDIIENHYQVSARKLVLPEDDRFFCMVSNSI